MTYNDIWHRLAAVYDVGEAKAVARMLLEERFGMSFADIICGGVEALSATDSQWLEEAVARLESSEPVQYVLGWAWFCGNRFDVGKGVLIPRPETEWLVERAIELATKRNTNDLRILDIGTGSGCIAVSMKKALPEAYVEAWDISADALAIAAANARGLGADVVFKLRDALDASDTSGSWDIIVSNPPYIREAERADMAVNVLDYEPESALFVPDDDPLLFYSAIARYAHGSLRHGGKLLFECNTRFATATADMMRSCGFDDVRVAADCFGKPRFAEGNN